MSLPIQTLRSSFDRVVELSPNLTHRFYEILFERHPRAQAMFGRHSQARQEKMLADALAAVIGHLEDGEWLTTTLRGMGAKHEGYGVTPEMYGWVGDALLATLAEALGDEWTPAVSSAWAAAFGAIAGLMQQGAAQARAA